MSNCFHALNFFYFEHQNESNRLSFSFYLIYANPKRPLALYAAAFNQSIEKHNQNLVFSLMKYIVKDQFYAGNKQIKNNC